MVGAVGVIGAGKEAAYARAAASSAAVNWITVTSPVSTLTSMRFMMRLLFIQDVDGASVEGVGAVHGSDADAV